MFEQCMREYQDMVSRVEAVIRENWPDALAGDGRIWVWLDEARPELRRKLRQLTEQLESSLKNGVLAEVKILITEWGRLQLEIYKGYARHLREAV